MSGYRRAAKVYRLTFEDEEFAGLEVRAKSIPTGLFLNLTDLAELGSAGSFTKEQAEQIKNLFETFAGALVSWNLETEDGEPVPATLEGVNSQEFDFIIQVITAWMQGIAGVAAPLAKRSNAGATIQEASLPMAPLS